jgi:hypothetical protein
MTCSRRSVLLGATALVTLAAGSARAADRLTVGALVDSAGRATARAGSMNGQAITILGYLAPPLLSGEAWLLGEGPAVPCQLCGEMHDIGATLTLALEAPLDPVPSPSRAVAIAGRLDLSSLAPRLIAARLAGA